MTWLLAFGLASMVVCVVILGLLWVFLLIIFSGKDE